jgi:hypothetical protein
MLWDVLARHNNISYLAVPHFEEHIDNIRLIFTPELASKVRGSNNQSHVDKDIDSISLLKCIRRRRKDEPKIETNTRAMPNASSKFQIWLRRRHGMDVTRILRKINPFISSAKFQIPFLARLFFVRMHSKYLYATLARTYLTTQIWRLLLLVFLVSRSLVLYFEYVIFYV